MSTTISFKQAKKGRRYNKKRVARIKAELLREMRAYQLAELRQSLNLTQTELAAIIGIDQSGVSRIERGAFTTTEVGTLAAYVEALGGHLEISVKLGSRTVPLTDSRTA